MAVQPRPPRAIDRRDRRFRPHDDLVAPKGMSHAHAKARGYIRYHGRPCKRAGHTIRYINGQGCATCMREANRRRKYGKKAGDGTNGNNRMALDKRIEHLTDDNYNDHYYDTLMEDDHGNEPD